MLSGSVFSWIFVEFTCWHVDTIQLFSRSTRKYQHRTDMCNGTFRYILSDVWVVERTNCNKLR